VIGRRTGSPRIAFRGRGALALLAALAVLALAATAGHSRAASAPISRVSSMIGTADGALVMGGDPTPAAGAPPGALWLLGASGAALAGLALTGSSLYRRFTRHIP
jgi:hypothetical protein